MNLEWESVSNHVPASKKTPMRMFAKSIATSSATINSSLKDQKKIRNYTAPHHLRSTMAAQKSAKQNKILNTRETKKQASKCPARRTINVVGGTDRSCLREILS